MWIQLLILELIDGASPAIVTVTEAATGGWLTYDERREGYEAYVRARRIELGILPGDEEQVPELAPAGEAAKAIAEVSERQAGLKMAPEQREADLMREFMARNLEWRDDYRQALYAGLYARELRMRRGIEALLMYMAAE